MEKNQTECYIRGCKLPALFGFPDETPTHCSLHATKFMGATRYYPPWYKKDPKEINYNLNLYN